MNANCDQWKKIIRRSTGRRWLVWKTNWFEEFGCRMISSLDWSPSLISPAEGEKCVENQMAMGTCFFFCSSAGRQDGICRRRDATERKKIEIKAKLKWTTWWCYWTRIEASLYTAIRSRQTSGCCCWMAGYWAVSRCLRRDMRTVAPSVRNGFRHVRRCYFSLPAILPLSLLSSTVRNTSNEYHRQINRLPPSLSIFISFLSFSLSLPLSLSLSLWRISQESSAIDLITLMKSAWNECQRRFHFHYSGSLVTKLISENLFRAAPSFSTDIVVIFLMNSIEWYNWLSAAEGRVDVCDASVVPVAVSAFDWLLVAGSSICAILHSLSRRRRLPSASLPRLLLSSSCSASADSTKAQSLTALFHYFGVVFYFLVFIFSLVVISVPPSPMAPSLKDNKKMFFFTFKNESNSCCLSVGRCFRRCWTSCTWIKCSV